MALPLKVKVSLRDNWENKEAPVHRSLARLEGIIGYKASLDPDWPVLHAALGGYYSDKANFVPATAGCVSAWCDAASQLLEDPSHEAWTEAVLEKLTEAGSRLKLILEVSRDENVSTSWNKERGAFIITLPNGRVTNPLANTPVFQAHLLSAIQDDEPVRTVPIFDSAGGAGDDWAAVEVAPTAQSFSAGPIPTAGPAPGAPRASVEYFPDINTLPRPDDLLQRPPYHLIINVHNIREIEIQCSHSPTLKFLSTYLEKWCRTNYQLSNKPPSVELYLHQCAFGLGTWYDRLTLYAENRAGGHCVTPTILLALLEGQLGYHQTSHEGARWVLRKDTAFKN